jgi:hypothetical protein
LIYRVRMPSIERLFWVAMTLLWLGLALRFA